MTLEEAIEHCKQVAMCCAHTQAGAECAREHRQLAVWLEELRLLRIAVQRHAGHVPPPMSIEEDFFIPAREPKPCVRNAEEEARDLAYFQKNLMNALKLPKEMYSKVKCTKCNGEGWRDGWPCRRECACCKGSGTVEVKVVKCTKCNGEGDDGGGPYLRTCRYCAGKGFVTESNGYNQYSLPCKTCRGTGKAR